MPFFAVATRIVRNILKFEVVVAAENGGGRKYVTAAHYNKFTGEKTVLGFNGTNVQYGRPYQ